MLSKVSCLLLSLYVNNTDHSYELLLVAFSLGYISLLPAVLDKYSINTIINMIIIINNYDSSC